MKLSKKGEYALRTLIIERSLAAHVISSMTAFVGVRRTIGEKSSGTLDVASAPPAGSSCRRSRSTGVTCRSRRTRAQA